MHICTSYEVFHPLSLPSTNLIFSFRSEGGERSSVGAKTSFSTMAARRAKHAKNEFVVQMPAKLLFMNLFLKTSPVVVAALIDIFRSLKVTICHFITMNLLSFKRNAQGENRKLNLSIALARQDH